MHGSDDDDDYESTKLRMAGSSAQVPNLKDLVYHSTAMGSLVVLIRLYYLLTLLLVPVAFQDMLFVFSLSYTELIHITALMTKFLHYSLTNFLRIRSSLRRSVCSTINVHMRDERQ